MDRKSVTQEAMTENPGEQSPRSGDSPQPSAGEQVEGRSGASLKKEIGLVSACSIIIGEYIQCILYIYDRKVNRVHYCTV